MSYQLNLVGHYLTFVDGVPTRKVWRETVNQTGPVNAKALREKLNRSFLRGGKNEVTGTNLVPHISLLQVVNPANRAVLDSDTAPVIEWA